MIRSQPQPSRPQSLLAYILKPHFMMTWLRTLTNAWWTSFPWLQQYSHMTVCELWVQITDYDQSTTHVLFVHQVQVEDLLDKKSPWSFKIKMIFSPGTCLHDCEAFDGEHAEQKVSFISEAYLRAHPPSFCVKSIFCVKSHVRAK